MLTVDIDRNSGFCAGVISAISRAEEFLDDASDSVRLFSLGAIVHNDAELSRLQSKGLITIDNEDLELMDPVQGETLLIRAHGEPPRTYRRAAELGFKVIDCTCPVVLKLQKHIREAYLRIRESGNGQILIFGKPGHAEVLGLIGQTDGEAFVVESLQSLENLVGQGLVSLERPIEIFSQTTKSPSEYDHLCKWLSSRVDNLRVHNTICRQVATRHEKLSAFAIEHDVIIFVSGKASSNGKVLCELCKELNIRTYHVDSPSEIKREWFRPDDKVGVCGATSTPKWLLERTAAFIDEIGRNQ